MKKINKLLALIMALSIILAMTLAAGAVNITVNDSNASAQYVGYKLLNLTTSPKDGAPGEFNYAYTVNDTYRAALATVTGEGTDDEILEYISKLDADGTRTFADAVYRAISSMTADATFASQTAKDVAQGYWLIAEVTAGFADGGAYSLALLGTAGGTDFTIEPKKDVPTIDKKVNTQSNGSGTWQDVADYNIGDTVPFRFTSKVPDMTGYDSYTFTVHDTMSAGLSFDGENSVTVAVGGTTLNRGTDYNVVVPGTDTCTFHIVFDAAKFINLETGAAIVIEYTATLDDDAAIASPGNPNEVYLEYSNNPYVESGTGTTPKDEVIVYTFEFEVVKVNSAGKRLSGAEFVLYRGTGENIQYAMIDDENKVSGWTAIKASAVFTVDEAYTITGLDAGTYYLEETQAPAGYNLLDEAVEIVVTPDYDTNDPPRLTSVTVSYGEPLVLAADGEDDNEIVEIVILNNAGFLFPETGGIGTTIFTIVGVCLMAGAAVVLIAKKKTSARN